MAEQSRRKQFIELMKERLDDLDKQLDKFEQKAEEANTESRKQYEARLAEMEEQRKKMKKRLNEMSDAGDKQWEQFKAHTEDTWKALENSFNYFRSHFK